MLKRSEAMCKASLHEDDDVDEEDVDRETGIIRVQLAYAIQMQVLLNTAFLLNKLVCLYETANLVCS